MDLSTRLAAALACALAAAPLACSTGSGSFRFADGGDGGDAKISVGSDAATGGDDVAFEDTSFEDDTSIDDDAAPFDTFFATDTRADTTITPADTGKPDFGVLPDGAVPAGRTGAICVAANDCDATDAYCTNAFYAVGAYNPTAVCVSVGSCEPSDDTTIRFCDGDLGVCTGTTASPVCSAMCRFDANGNYLQRCAGGNACDPFAYADSSNGRIALGQCRGGCTSDAQCPAGNKCDPTYRACFATCTSDTQCKSRWTTAPASWGCDLARGACTLKTVKTLGDPCTNGDECLCIHDTANTAGYCSIACRTGAPSPCGSGYVCDAFLDGPTPGPGFTAVPVGVTGYCARTCTTVAECPTGAKCERSGGMTQSTCRF